MTFEDFKTWLERESKAVVGIKDDFVKAEDYGSAAFWRGYQKAIGKVLSTLDSVEVGEIQNKVRNEFSWDNVNIGDKCVNSGYTGTVNRLIFDGDGYCCGMTVDYSDSDSGDRWTTVYQDNEYNCCEQIGGWVNERGVY